MGVDEAVMVAAGTAAVEPGLLQMAARPIDALLRHAGNGAIGGAAGDLSRSNLDDAADADDLDSSPIEAGNVGGAAIHAISDEGQGFPPLAGRMLVCGPHDPLLRRAPSLN